MAFSSGAHGTTIYDGAQHRCNSSALPRPIRVGIADARPVMRTGLVQTIETEPQLHVVAHAASCAELTECLRMTTVDVLVIDPIGLGVPPVPLMRELTLTYRQLGVVVFSAVIDFVPELLAAGVHSVVAQKEPDDELRLAIRAAKARQRYLSPLVHNYVNSSPLSMDRSRLRPRELHCLMYMAEGLDNQAISLRMDVELRTIENYISKIRAKLGCESRMQMIAWYQLVYDSRAHTSAEACLTRSGETDLRSVA